MATPWRAGPDLDLAQAFLDQRLAQVRRAAPAATGRPPDGAIRPERAQASGTPAPILRRAWCSFSTRSSGRNGQSPGTLTIHSMPLFCAASQSSPARMPASGPGWSGTLSGTTAQPVSAKRSGSPLALMMMPVHCADSVASTRSRMVTPPISMRALSPPPMRRASPPASTRPRVGGGGSCIVMRRDRASSTLPRARRARLARERARAAECRGKCAFRRVPHPGAPTRRRPPPQAGEVKRVTALHSSCTAALRRCFASFLPRQRRGPGRTRCGPRRRARRNACRARGRSASGWPCAPARRPRR